MKRKPGYIFGIDSSIFLLLSTFAFVFIFPAIDGVYFHDLFSIVAYSLVIVSIFSIVKNKNSWVRYVVILALVANFMMLFDSHDYIKAGTFLISAIVFVIATGLLISHIAANKNVTIAVIIQAISGYLLIGIIGSLLSGILLVFDPDAITNTAGNDRFSAIIYYTFITLTTIGYGEIIPVTVTARSISIFIGVSGQIYLTVIIAMIVGKYLSFKYSEGPKSL